MINIKRLTFLAVLFLVVARICVGWQLFYEGVWKFRRVGTANEWSAAPYLRNSRGPLRPVYRGMMNDPDDLLWLDYTWVEPRWKSWQEQFVSFHELTKEQQAQLAEMMDGPKEIVGRGRLPAIAIDLQYTDRRTKQKNPRRANIGGSLAKAIELREFTETDKNNRERTVWRFVVKGDWHLTPRERDILLRLGKKAEDAAKKSAAAAKKGGDAGTEKVANRQAALAAAFQRAVRDVYKLNAKLAFREKLAVLLKGDSERITFPEPKLKGTIDYKRPDKTSEYKERLARYDEMLSGVQTDFQQRHLNEEAARIRTLHGELVRPVKTLEWEMQQAALKLLTEAQRSQGQIPVAPPTNIDRIDQATMWGLMVIGVLLMVGLFSRSAAAAGGLLVLSFYLAMPPWPGVPQPPGPEHSLFINKNAIEFLALFALAFIPTGKFFGIDTLLTGLFGSRATPATASAPAASQRTGSTSSSPVEPSTQSTPVAAATPSKSTYPVRSPESKR